MLALAGPVHASLSAASDMLFMDLLDVEKPYGLIQPRANTLELTRKRYRPPPGPSYSAGALVIATIPSVRNQTLHEVYVVNSTGWEPLLLNDNPPPPAPDAGVQLLRFLTSNFWDYTSGSVVLDLPSCSEGVTALKSIARDDTTGRYVMFTAEPSPGAGYQSFISLDAGNSWTMAKCGESKVATSHKNSSGCVKHPDKDDLNLIYNKGRFVDMQIVWRQNVTMRYCDGPCGQARTITAKTSNDGVDWSKDLDMILPDPVLDPPDLQFYRMRPFYIGNSSRIAAHTLQYAPQPPQSIVGTRYGRQPSKCKNGNSSWCHGPHIHEEWWIGPKSGDAADVLQWRRPYRYTSAAPHDAFLMSQPATVTLPPTEQWEVQHLWVTGGGIYVLPLYRIAGLYSPSNAEFSTPAFTLSKRPIALNADVSWHGRLVTGGCDEGCAAYVFCEILNASTGAPIAGFDRFHSNALMDVNGLQLPLQWSADGTNATAQYNTTALPSGVWVQVRIGFRDAVIYALMVQ